MVIGHNSITIVVVWERFTVVDAGNGQNVLNQPSHRAWTSMKWTRQTMPSHFQHPAHLSLGRMRIRAESRFCQSMFVELLILYPSLCKQSSSTVKENVQASPRLFGVALPHRSRFAATLRGSSCFSFFDKVWCFLQCFNCQELILPGGYICGAFWLLGQRPMPRAILKSSRCIQSV
jgi:hypothetical protein